MIGKMGRPAESRVMGGQSRLGLLLPLLRAFTFSDDPTEDNKVVVVVVVLLLLLVLILLLPPLLLLLLLIPNKTEANIKLGLTTYTSHTLSLAKISF